MKTENYPNVEKATGCSVEGFFSIGIALGAGFILFWSSAFSRRVSSDELLSVLISEPCSKIKLSAIDLISFFFSDLGV